MVWKTVTPSSHDFANLVSLSDTATRTTRTGTIRNTDSFFGDDSAEPRKISLTPNLLRENSGESSVRSSGSLDKGPVSHEVLDLVDKPSQDRTKDDKRKKEKKSTLR